MHVCLVCDHLKIHIVPVLAITNIVQTIFKMLDIFIITAYMHFSITNICFMLHMFITFHT